jgi:APA family basic amino acid/polyamine antiporter
VTSGELRRLGTADAVVLGLAAMLGTGVFAVWGPAAAAAGPWLPLAVLLAGVVAACNAASSADLAVRYPESGGGYVYGHERICPGAGRLAGVAFLVGKLSSAAAAAGVFGQYVLPSAPMVAAIPAVLVVTVLNTAGVRWTARSAYSLVGGTLVVLLVVVVIGFCVPVTAAAPVVPAADLSAGGPLGVLTAAGLVFFAFAGYARIATLAGEVIDPARTVRRAIAIALGVALVTYLLVATALLIGLGAERLATESTPLVVLVDGAGANGLGVLIRVGAAVAAGSALLSVLVGVSRTAAAMARRGDLPEPLGRVGPRGTPWRADAIAGLITVVVSVLAGPAASIALSACSVLVYYAVVNLSAIRLPAAHRTWPAWVSAAGLLLCVGLALLLPLPQVLVTAAALVLGWSAVTVRRRRR